MIRLKLEVLEDKQKEEKWNESQLALAMGIDRTTLWRVKTGRATPGEDFIAGALKAFPKCKFDDLFFIDKVLRDGHNSTSQAYAG